MFRKTVAASVIAIWLALLGIEFSEAAELIKQVDKDKSVETETASFGVAFQVLDGSRQVGPTAILAQAQAFNLPADRGLARWSVAYYLRKEAQFLKGHFKIFRFHRVMLI